MPERLITSSDKEVSTWINVHPELANHHFNEAHDVFENTLDRASDTDYFEIDELKYAVETLLPNKAPDFDGLGLEIIRIVLQHHARWLLGLYSLCLRESCLATHLEIKRVLDRKKFVFRRKLSPVDALEKMLEYTAELKEQSKYTCLVAFEIKNAFNGVRRTDVLCLFMEDDVDPDLLGLTGSFLQERTICTSIGDNDFNMGVPQVSRFGRFFLACSNKQFVETAGE